MSDFHNIIIHFFIIIIILLTASSYYFFTKYEDHKNENIQLKENLSHYKTRVKDLCQYKNDVSKTFKYLDKELIEINNHVNNHVKQSNEERSSHSFNNRVNLLTPEMISNLISQEFPLIHSELQSTPLASTDFVPNPTSNIPSNNPSLNTDTISSYVIDPYSRLLINQQTTQ